MQLIIFAPNHAAAARAHGSWRPLPAARQFAPVRALPLPVTLGAVAHQSSGALLPWRRTPAASMPASTSPSIVLISACARPQEMPIAGTRAHAAMLRSRLASPILQHSSMQHSTWHSSMQHSSILQHSPTRERRKLVFG